MSSLLVDRRIAAPFRGFGRSYCGRGCRALLPELMRSSQLRRIFLIRGEASFFQSPIQSLMKQIDDDVEFVHFSDFTANPKSTDLERAILQYRQEGCDGILSIGGGTALDLGKLLSAFVQQPQLVGFRDFVGASPHADGRTAPLILMPTTAGSGAESTDFSVLYKDSKKYSFAVGGYGPENWVSLTDSALSDSQPSRLTACSGLDALCQAAESLWAKGADRESREYAFRALKLAANNIVDAVTTGSQRSRDAMARAGHIAGQAINRSKTTAPHALSYGLSSDYAIAHGHAVALMFGPILSLHAQANIPQALQIMDTLGFESAGSCASEFRALIGALGLETSLTALGVEGPAAMERLVAGVNQDRLLNNPITLANSDIRAVYDSVI